MPSPGPGDPRQAADRAPQWSPKGRWILFETGRRGHNNLMVVSEDGMVTDYLTQSNVDERSASWSPDGTRISYTARAPEYFSGKLNVLKFDPAKGQASGDPVTLYTSPADRGGGWSIRKARWSPDGRTLAVVLQDSGWDNVYLIPAAGGAPKAITQGELGGRESRVFAGRKIAGGRVEPQESRRNTRYLDRRPWTDRRGACHLRNFEAGMRIRAESGRRMERRYISITTLRLSRRICWSADRHGRRSAEVFTHTTPKIFDERDWRCPR